MISNIQCFKDGCNNPVIGLCSGYKGGCGLFHCRTHTVRKHCAECGQREQIDVTFQDYFEMARELHPKETSLRVRSFKTGGWEEKFDDAWEKTLNEVES